VTDEINAQNTIETISLARKKACELLNTNDSTSVMMDPGTENRNEKVLKFISSKNLIRTLARVDIHYSNSMVERLFLSLKNNYLYHQNVNCIEGLKRKADFYFREHNEVIPLAILKGGRPREVFRSKWNEEERNELQANKELAFLNRRKKNLEPPCGVCPV
jgi:hypothetical protein